MTKTLSQEQIAKELDELKDKISRDSPYMAEEWQRFLPGISPKELAAQFSQFPGEPKIRITFLPRNDNRALAAVTITDKRASELERAGDAPFYLSFDVHDDHILLHKCNVGPSHQGAHLAKKLLGSFRDIALALGKPSVTLSATDKGAYAWAKFGFTPSNDIAWDTLKEKLAVLHLNGDCTQMQYHPWKLGTFAKQFPDGFSLTPEETGVLNRIMASNDPKDIYLLSDMGRVVGHTPGDSQTPSHPITVGKALLCDTTWDGTLNLVPGDPGYERFCNYISPALSKVRSDDKGVAG